MKNKNLIIILLLLILLLFIIMRKIVNPITKEKVNLFSIEGFKILRKYIQNYLGGKKEQFSSVDKQQLYDDLLENHYQNIFPNNQNRNSAGFRFFKYIYDNLATSEELFDIYNQFYCAVSGSIVPPRENNYNILKVKDRNGKCVFGKYYRCCTPCNCDIMKFATVIPTKIELPKNSNKFVTKMLLTINDPCSSDQDLPSELDKEVFQCNQQNLLEKGYRVNEKNELTKGQGKLVIGVLYPIQEEEKKQVESALTMCQERISMGVNELQYGMGDIFVKLAKMNDSTEYKNDESDLCK